VVHLPYGSFPSPTQGYARRDDAFYFEYHRATRERAGFENWLRQWVLDVPDHREFLARLPQERVAALKPSQELFAPAANFSY
jgi:glutaconate CoA-transferase subunit A